MNAAPVEALAPYFFQVAYVVRDIAELLLQSVAVKVAADTQPHANLRLDQEACHV